jgi:hypothetical protein
MKLDTATALDALSQFVVDFPQRRYFYGQLAWK